MKLEMIHYGPDGQLQGADDAGFVARMIKRSFAGITEISWMGIDSVSDEYLDIIFSGISPEDLEPKMAGMSDAVGAALGRWVDRQTSPQLAELPKSATKTKPVETKTGPAT
jgi:hypothetical protein